MKPQSKMHLQKYKPREIIVKFLKIDKVILENSERKIIVPTEETK